MFINNFLTVNISVYDSLLENILWLGIGTKKRASP